MCKNNDDSFGFAIGILAGMVGGVIAGVLFAPKSGEESRKELKEAVENIYEKYSPEVIKAKEQALDAIKSSKDKIEDAYKNFNEYLKPVSLQKPKITKQMLMKCR